MLAEVNTAQQILFLFTFIRLHSHRIPVKMFRLQTIRMNGTICLLVVPHIPYEKGRCWYESINMFEFYLVGLCVGKICWTGCHNTLKPSERSPFGCVYKIEFHSKAKYCAVAMVPTNSIAYNRKTSFTLCVPIKMPTCVRLARIDGCSRIIKFSRKRSGVNILRAKCTPAL